MTQVMYCQCRLAKKTATGEQIQYSWIPQKYAVVGKILKLRGENYSGCLVSHTEWDNGWTITHVWETQTEQEVKAHARGYARWREITDI